MTVSYSDVAADTSVDALPISVIIGVVTDIGVDVLAVVMTDSEFAISKESNC